VIWLLLGGVMGVLAQEDNTLIQACKDVDGTAHKLGEAYIGPDGCNRCKCMEGGSACTRKLCPPDFSSREAEANLCVDHKGVLHEEGSSYTHVDGCNTCTCTQAGGACTRRFCLSSATCEGGEKTEGQSWLHRDGCNKCQCSIFGTVCSEMKCAALEPKRNLIESGAGAVMVDESGDQPCTDRQNITHLPGADWLTEDSCNICTCTGVSRDPWCTAMGCRVRLERLLQSGDGNSGAGLPSLPSLLLLTVLTVVALY